MRKHQGKRVLCVGRNVPGQKWRGVSVKMASNERKAEVK